MIIIVQSIIGLEFSKENDNVTKKKKKITKSPKLLLITRASNISTLRIYSEKINYGLAQLVDYLISLFFFF